MSQDRRRVIYRVAHDTGLSLWQIVRECQSLSAIEIARKYGVLSKPARSA